MPSCRQPLFYAVSVLWVTVQSVGAQSIQNTLPMEQTVDGITLSIRKAGFATDIDAQRLSFMPQEDTQKGFVLTYDVHSALPAKNPGVAALPQTASTDKKPAAWLTTDARLYSPTGEPLYQRMMARSAAGGSEKWRDVAPYWDHVKAAFEVLDPAAPVGADGKFETALEFKNVPLPRKFDQPQEVNQTLTTARGTPIVLEKIAAHAVKDQEGGVEGQLELTVRWDWSPRVPDDQVEMELSRVVDGTGKELQLSGSTSRQDHRYTFPVPALPPKAVQTINVTVKVNEDAPSLKQPQWFKHFNFELKLPTFATIAANAPAAPNAAQLQVKPLTAEADGVLGEWESDEASDYYLRAHLWLRDQLTNTADALKQMLPGAQREWDIKALVGRDKAGNEQRQMEEINSDHIYFKTDGRPAQANERGQSLALSFKDNHKPENLSVEAIVEPVQHLHQVFNFDAIPLPKPEQISEVNKEIKLPSGARTVLRRVSYFTAPDDLSGAPSKLRDKLQPPHGLALIFEAIPALPGNNARQNFSFSQASDNQGHELKSNTYTSAEPGDALVATIPPAPHRWTVYLLPPAADAKTMQVQVVTDEIASLGPSRTLTFPDVPLPKPQPIYL